MFCNNVSRKNRTRVILVTAHQVLSFASGRINRSQVHWVWKKTYLGGGGHWVMPPPLLTLPFSKKEQN